jgi:hypothetical protein
MLVVALGQQRFDAQPAENLAVRLGVVGNYKFPFKG